MGIKSAAYKLPPLVKKAKYLLLFVSALLIVANFYFLTETRNHAKSYNKQQNQATWFLFQLTKEFSELNATLPFAATDEESKQSALLKYELAWSRFDLLLNSRESDSFIKLPGAEEFFTSLFEKYQSLEPKLDLISDPKYTKQVNQEFEALYISMIDFINTNFRVQSPLYQSQMGQAYQLYALQLASLVLLMIGVVLATYILQKESLYHREKSLTDPLTEIPNRLAFMGHLLELEEADNHFALILLDLNGFKKINDGFGHQAGDTALKSIASRLHQLEPNYPLSVFRIGGDEFALVSNETQKDKLDKIIKKVEDCFVKPVLINEIHLTPVSTSIGVSRYPQDTSKIHHLISVADQNMYKMKFGQKSSTSNVYNFPH